MKPSKKQNNAKTLKKSVVEKSSTSGIKTFFKSAPKSFVVEQNVAEPVASTSKDVNKSFYVGILKEKLARMHGEENIADDNGEDQAVDNAIEQIVILSTDQKTSSEIDDPKGTNECSGCIEKTSEIDEWKNKYNLEEAERKHWKKLYFNLTHHFSELHSKHDDLLKAATTRSVSETSDNAASTSPSNDIFTAAEVKFLQCMDLEKKNDCTFVLHCLKYAYKGDKSVLAKKTLKGTLEWTKISADGENIVHPAKDPLTPRKVERIKGLFVERISKCKIDAVEYASRITDPYVNKLIAAGIKNLSNTAGVKNSKQI